MNLFALTQGPARRILRIPLSREIQTEVETMFRRQETDFVASVEEEHAFDGKYTPEEGECLVIAGYADVNGLHEAVEHPLGHTGDLAGPSRVRHRQGAFRGLQVRSGRASRFDPELQPAQDHFSDWIHPAPFPRHLPKGRRRRPDPRRPTGRHAGRKPPEVPQLPRHAPGFRSERILR